MILLNTQTQPYFLNYLLSSCYGVSQFYDMFILLQFLCHLDTGYFIIFTHKIADNIANIRSFFGDLILYLHLIRYYIKLY